VLSNDSGTDDRHQAIKNNNGQNNNSEERLVGGFHGSKFRFRRLDLNVKIFYLFFSCKKFTFNLSIADPEGGFNFEIWPNQL